MTGPEHYLEAERILAEFPQLAERQITPAGAAVLMAEAQVHATLALAASHSEPIHMWREALKLS